MKFIYFLTILVLLMAGCITTKAKAPALSSPTVPASIYTPTRTLSPIYTALPLTTITTTPLAPTPVSEKTLHFDQGPEPLDFSDEEYAGCIGPKDWSGLDIRSGKGLATYSRTDKALQIWGDEGYRTPAYSIKKTSPALFFINYDLSVSPDHEWLYYWYRPDLDYFDVYVVDPKTGEKIQRHFEGITLAGSPGPYWASPSYLVFPLQFEKYVFDWMVWDPFTDKVEFVSARLPGIGTAIELTHLGPVYDPRSGLVIYACNACGADDFRAYHIPSQSVAWGVDFGEDSLMLRQIPPIRSEDGELTAFYFWQINKLWIVNQRGESVLKAITSSEADVSMVSALEFSPDGKRLGIIRVSKDPESPILSILSLEDGKLVNLCAPIRYGNLGWSYDNRTLFYISERSTDYTESVIGILDTTTGAGWQEVIPEDLVFTGWLKP